MSVLEDFDTIYEHSHMWNWGPDWMVVKDIYQSFPQAYSVLTPFAYTYLEELIRSTTSEYVKPMLKPDGTKNYFCIGTKLINLAIKENSTNTKYIELLEKTKRYFTYEYKHSEEENGRNNVMHGHLHPRFWTNDDFEKLIHDIAELSPFAGF